MSRYISESIRKFIAERANFRCEYCRVYEKYSFLSFHIEHIISLKHGGKSSVDNLAYSCPICNINKGTDIATFIELSSEPVRFFNPRIDEWTTHFQIESSGFILSKTHIGQATVKILGLNHPDSIIERREMISKNIFQQKTPLFLCLLLSISYAFLAFSKEKPS